MDKMDDSFVYIMKIAASLFLLLLLSLFWYALPFMDKQL